MKDRGQNILPGTACNPANKAQSILLGFHESTQRKRVHDRDELGLVVGRRRCFDAFSALFLRHDGQIYVKIAAVVLDIREEWIWIELRRIDGEFKVPADLYHQQGGGGE